MATDRERKLETIIAGFLKPAKGLPFEVVIRSLYDAGVEAFDLNTPENRETLDRIVLATRQTCLDVQADPIKRQRPNEVGNDIEPFVMRSLTRQQLRAERPKTRAGGLRSTGYPDIRIERSGSLPIYLEVKTYALENHNTTFRSFYLSPSDQPKVIDTAHHLLVGFEIEREGNLFRPAAFEIVDLYGLECDLKAEFNSDNRRLYDKRRRLAEGRIPCRPSMKSG